MGEREDLDPVVETWEYDVADRLVAHRRPYDPVVGLGPATTYGYDVDFGWLATVTDPTGRVATFERYDDGEVRAEVHAMAGLDTIVTERWRDGRGRVVAREDTVGAETTLTGWSFARDGRQVEADHPGGRSVAYGWNLDGTTAWVTHSDGSQRRYVRDVVGRVTGVAVAPTASGVGVPLATVAYDVDGRRTGETVHAAGGSARSWGYDGSGRVAEYVQVWDDGVGWDVTGSSLVYRSDGRLGSQLLVPGGSEAYGYDAAGQLSDVGGSVAPSSVSYGPRGNPVSASVPVGVGYGYNADGSVAGSVAADGTVTTFSYDAAGRRTGRESRSAGGGVLRSTTVTYDAAGRVAVTDDRGVGRQATTVSREWDGDGHLAWMGVVKAGALVQPEISYVWDTTNGLATVLDGYLLDEFFVRFDQASETLGYQIDDGEETLVGWYGYDALGDLVNPHENPNLVDASVAYGPWGQALPDDRTRVFDSYRHEARLGDFVHLRARDYQPSARQFLTPDPLDGVDGTPTVANPYHYADNDPLNKTDPLGLRPSDDELWGDAKPSTMTFWFPVDNNHKWFGEIHVAGFIPQDQTSMTPGHGPGPRWFEGDDRGFTAAGNLIDPNKNRFFARLNFSTGMGFIQVNPTCRAEGAWLPGSQCTSGRKIVYGEYDGNNPLDPKYDKNFAVMQRSGDTYRFKWSVVHADQGVGQDLLRARADGKLDFKFVDGGSFVETTWSGDCFPSVEVMRVSGGTTQVIGQVRDAGAEAMIGGVTNLYNFFGAC